MHHYHYYGFFSTVSNHCTHCETTVTLSISEGNKIILINFSWKFPKSNRITARLILHYVCISYLHLDLERKKKNFQAKKKKSIFQLSLSTPKCYSSTSLITSIKDHQSCPFFEKQWFFEGTHCMYFCWNRCIISKWTSLTPNQIHGLPSLMAAVLNQCCQLCLNFGLK